MKSRPWGNLWTSGLLLGAPWISASCKLRVGSEILTITVDILRRVTTKERGTLWRVESLESLHDILDISQGV